MKMNSIALACATVLAAAIAMPVDAQSNRGNKQAQGAGASGLVAAVVQVAANDVVDVRVVDSLNNLIAVENVLNNSPILSSNDIDVTVGDISLLDGLDIDVNALGITLDDIAGVVLATSDGTTDVIILR